MLLKKAHILVVIVVCTCCLLAVVGCSKKEGASSAAPARGGAVAEGKAAVDFTLKDLQGKDVHLADFKGKVVLVNFWATWCPPCREEIPSMVKLNATMAGKPFQMLCISIDEGGKPDVDAFFAKEKLTLPVLLDPAAAVGKQYGLTGVPETFIVDKKGQVVKKVIGGVDWVSPEVVGFLTNLINQP